MRKEKNGETNGKKGQEKQERLSIHPLEGTGKDGDERVNKCTLLSIEDLKLKLMTYVINTPY